MQNVLLMKRVVLTLGSSCHLVESIKTYAGYSQMDHLEQFFWPGPLYEMRVKDRKLVCPKRQMGITHFESIVLLLVANTVYWIWCLGKG